MKTNRLFSQICLFVAGWCLAPAARAQFTYATNNGSIIITRYISTSTGGAVIPDTIAGMPVTAIGAYAFAGCANLTAITISTNVTSLGTGAFMGSHLSSILLSTNVTTIGDYAFKGCFNLTGFTLGNPSASSQLASIGAYAFADCIGLTSGLTIPNSVTSLGAYAFSGCYNLQSLTLSTNITSLSDGLFNDCYSLNNVTLPTSVNLTRIGAYTFNGCHRFNFTLPNNLISIGDYAFADCTGWGASGGISITFPNSVTSIGAYAFSDCFYLTGVFFGANLATIGAGAFNNCHGLNNGLTIPNSVTTIGDYAFNGCGNLPLNTLGTSGSLLASIGAYAFANCAKLGSYLTLPGNVTTIGAGAFSGCIHLPGVSIGANVTSIGTGAFSGCSSFGSSGISVLSGNPVYASTAGGLFNKNFTTWILCPVGFSGTAQVPSMVTNIAPGAFLGCSSLTGIVLNNAVLASVGGVLFKKSGSVLTLIQYPGGLNNAAYTLSNNVTGIADNAFDNCYGLTSLFFQGNEPALGTNLFVNFNQTAIVYYAPSTVGWGATYGGLTALLLNPQAQLVNVKGAAVLNNAFAFTITGTNNEVVVVDTSTNLANPSWQPIQTNTLTGVTYNFNDPQWTNHPTQFYRIHAAP